MTRRFQVSLCPLAATIIAALILVWATMLKLPQAIRRPSTISAIRARLDQRATVGLPPVEEFDVPSTHFASIVEPLSHARVDYSPAKWQVLGKLTITGNDGSDTTIDLFVTGPAADPGIAFRCDKTYYLGGSALALETAILAAKAEAEKEM